MNRIIDKNACAYKEIYEILKIFPKELVSRIPQEKIVFFRTNMDNDYEYNVSVDTFDGQTMLEETKAILTILFRDYWATPVQREKLINFTKNAQNIVEEENKEKYNPDNIFKKYNKEDEIIENSLQKEVSLVEYKESIFRKVINKIKSIFYIK